MLFCTIYNFNSIIIIRNQVTSLEIIYTYYLKEQFNKNTKLIFAQNLRTN